MKIKKINTNIEENIKILKLEMDYHLASLHLEMQQNDKEAINKTKQRLKEILEELDILKEKKEIHA